MNEYLGWEVTQLRQGVWKATKNGNSLNATNAKLLKAMIGEQEGVSIRDNSIERLAKRENKGSKQSDLMMRKAFEKLKKKVDYDDF